MEYKMLTTAEIPLMENLAIEGFRQFSSEDITSFIDEPNTYGFVAKDNNTIVGLCYGYAMKRPDKADPMFYLHSLGVLESHQNQGIGTKLVEFVTNYAFEKLNCYECFLVTEKSNPQACRVYEKFGTKRWGDEIVYVIKKNA